MCNEQETYFDRDLSSAVLLVRKYLDCDCTDENCPFDLLVRAVQHSRDEEARKEFERQEAIVNQKIEGDIE
jgi:hypothetical protein